MQDGRNNGFGWGEGETPKTLQKKSVDPGVSFWVPEKWVATHIQSSYFIWPKHTHPLEPQTWKKNVTPKEYTLRFSIHFFYLKLGGMVDFLGQVVFF